MEHQLAKDKEEETTLRWDHYF